MALALLTGNAMCPSRVSWAGVIYEVLWLPPYYVLAILASQCTPSESVCVCVGNLIRWQVNQLKVHEWPFHGRFHQLFKAIAIVPAK